MQRRRGDRRSFIKYDRYSEDVQLTCHPTSVSALEMDTSMTNQDKTSNMDVIHSKEDRYISSDHDLDVKSPANDPPNRNDDENDEHWLLQIKMVGSETNQSDFHISLHPNDDITRNIYFRKLLRSPKQFHD